MSNKLTKQFSIQNFKKKSLSFQYYKKPEVDNLCFSSQNSSSTQTAKNLKVNKSKCRESNFNKIISFYRKVVFTEEKQKINQKKLFTYKKTSLFEKKNQKDSFIKPLIILIKPKKIQPKKRKLNPIKNPEQKHSINLKKQKTNLKFIQLQKDLEFKMNKWKQAKKKESTIMRNPFFFKNFKHSDESVVSVSIDNLSSQFETLNTTSGKNELGKRPLKISKNEKNEDINFKIKRNENDKIHLDIVLHNDLNTNFKQSIIENKNKNENDNLEEKKKKKLKENQNDKKNEIKIINLKEKEIKNLSLFEQLKDVSPQISEEALKGIHDKLNNNEIAILYSVFETLKNENIKKNLNNFENKTDKTEKNTNSKNENSSFIDNVEKNINYDSKTNNNLIELVKESKKNSKIKKEEENFNKIKDFKQENNNKFKFFEPFETLRTNNLHVKEEEKKDPEIKNNEIKNLDIKNEKILNLTSNPLEIKEKTPDLEIKHTSQTKEQNNEKNIFFFNDKENNLKKPIETNLFNEKPKENFQTNIKNIIDNKKEETKSEISEIPNNNNPIQYIFQAPLDENKKTDLIKLESNQENKEKTLLRSFSFSEKEKLNDSTPQILNQNLQESNLSKLTQSEYILPQQPYNPFVQVTQPKLSINDLIKKSSNINFPENIEKKNLLSNNIISQKIEQNIPPATVNQLNLNNTAENLFNNSNNVFQQNRNLFEPKSTTNNNIFAQTNLGNNINPINNNSFTPNIFNNNQNLQFHPNNSNFPDQNHINFNNNHQFPQNQLYFNYNNRNNDRMEIVSEHIQDNFNNNINNNNFHNFPNINHEFQNQNFVNNLNNNNQFIHPDNYNSYHGYNINRNNETHLESYNNQVFTNQYQNPINNQLNNPLFNNTQNPQNYNIFDNNAAFEPNNQYQNYMNEQNHYPNQIPNFLNNNLPQNVGEIGNLFMKKDNNNPATVTNNQINGIFCDNKPTPKNQNNVVVDQNLQRVMNKNKKPQIARLNDM